MSVIAAAVLALNAGCPGPAVWFYDLDGSGFDVNEGMTVYVALVDSSSSAVIGIGSDVVAGGAFHANVTTHSWTPGVRFDYYADVNGNGQCDAPPADDVWTSPPASEASGPEQSTGLNIVVTHDTNYTPAACGSFQ